MSIINGSIDKETLECCNVCGGYLFIPEYYPKWDCKSLKCFDCEIEQYDKIITPEMIKYSRNKTITNSSIIYKSPNTKKFYEEKAIELYGDKNKWFEIFIDKEVSKLPTYSQEKGKNTLKSEKRKAERAANPLPPYSPPKPHCPTCNSTNVQKISDLRKAGGALMFGLLSTTARSQFECKNCGYKW